MNADGTSPLHVQPVGERVLEIVGLNVALPRGSDRTMAVTDVSLDVRRGEIVCVVGESGSGKSMIAHTVMGLLPPALEATSGSLRLDGEELFGTSTSRLRTL